MFANTANDARPDSRPTKTRGRRTPRWIAAWAVTGILVTSATSSLAGGRGCGCGSSSPFGSASVDTCACQPRCTAGGGIGASMGSAFKRSLVYKALDGMAGGIERTLGLDQCHASGCDQANCDDACDAAMIGELMVPMPHSDSHAIPMPVQPRSRHIYSQPIESAPRNAEPDVIQPQPHVAPTAPKAQTKMRMSKPRWAPQDNDASPLGQSPRGERQPPVPSSPPAQAPPEPPLPQPTEPQRQSDSLFDSLSNPFTDDEARVSRDNPVRASNYEAELKQKSHVPRIERLPLSHSHHRSSRRSSSNR